MRTRQIKNLLRPAVVFGRISDFQCHIDQSDFLKNIYLLKFKHWVHNTFSKEITWFIFYTLLKIVLLMHKSQNLSDSITNKLNAAL